MKRDSKGRRANPTWRTPGKSSQRTIEDRAHIKWNRRTVEQAEGTAQTSKWFFLLIHAKREQDLYAERIREYFSKDHPINIVEETSGHVEGRNLPYSLLTFESPKGEIDFTELILGNRMRDERLYDRETLDVLINYIEGKMAKTTAIY